MIVVILVRTSIDPNGEYGTIRTPNQITLALSAKLEPSSRKAACFSSDQPNAWAMALKKQSSPHAFDIFTCSIPPIVHTSRGVSKNRLLLAI